MMDATSTSPSPSRGMQRLTGDEYSDVRKVITMGTQQKWMGMIVIVATLLLGSAIPGHTDRGGHGGGGHGGGWWGGPRVGIGIGIGPYWGPYWGDTGDPMRMPTPMVTPMATRPSSQCHPPNSMRNPQHRPLPSPLHPFIGTTATMHGGITPMSSSAPEDGER
jgi:hypothetical protein